MAWELRRHIAAFASDEDSLVVGNAQSIKAIPRTLRKGMTWYLTSGEGRLGSAQQETTSVSRLLICLRTSPQLMRPGESGSPRLVSSAPSEVVGIAAR